MDCCEYLLSEIAFYEDSIRPCCSFSIPYIENKFIKEFKGGISGIKDYLQKRDEYIKDFTEGRIPFCFNNCTTYKKSETNSNDFKLNNIIISNQTKCSCRCIYCEQSDYGNINYRKIINKFKTYDIKPLLMYLRNNSYIADNCRFLICGGECCEYPKGELEWLIYFANICNGKLLILSSGIIYSKTIKNALLMGNTILKISIDSGTKNTYEKIKRIKAYDTTWKNIKNYVKFACKEKESYVELKYIIIPEYNDTEKEINYFLEKCLNTGVNRIVLDLEHKYLSEHKNDKNAKSHISKLLNYFFYKVKTTYDNKIQISLEGVEEDWLWSLIDAKYNFKKRV